MSRPPRSRRLPIDADFARAWARPGVPGLRVGPARWTGVYFDGGKPNPPAPIPRGRSSFDYFFAPIYPRLAEFYLADLPSLWWGNPFDTDPDFRALVDLLPRDDYVPPHTYFPEFARHTGEGDWMDLCFLREPRCTLETFYARQHDPAFFWANVDVWIRNVDGAFWLLFTKHPDLLDTTRHHLATLPGTYCTPMTTESDT